MLFKLSNVVTDGDNHICIEPSNTTSVEVIENTPVYCRIPSKFLYPPAKIKFKHETKTDLKVYISTIYKTPDSKNSDRVYNRPKLI